MQDIQGKLLQALLNDANMRQSALRIYAKQMGRRDGEPERLIGPPADSVQGA